MTIPERMEQRRAALSIARQRRIEREIEEAEAERTALYGPVVMRRMFIIPRIHAEARHIVGESEVTLHLIRDGKPVAPAQSHRSAVDAILASIEHVKGMGHDRQTQS